MNEFIFFHSDRFQEYKQKHLERKAAALKELGIKLPNGPITSEAGDRGQKSSDKDTGCGKEAEDRGSSSLENNSESQQEQPVEVTAAVSANGHVVQPAEQIQHKEKTNADREESDRPPSDSEGKIVNGESGVRVAGQKTETSVQNGVESSTANGENKCEATCVEMKSGEKHDERKGTGDITTNPSVLKSKATWADIVAKAPTDVNGTKDKEPVVNGVACNVSANGSAKE